MSTPPGTAWQRIARDIAERISSGDWPVGSKIASHQQLITRHEASLGTVKRALEHLQVVGVVQGVRGSGVFVLRLPTREDLTFEVPAREREGRDITARLAGLEQVVARLKQAVAQLERSDEDLRELVDILRGQLSEPHPSTAHANTSPGTIK